MGFLHGQDPVAAAQRIVGDVIYLQDALKATAEGFAVLDFAQGRVAIDLPAQTAHDIVAVLRPHEALDEHAALDELVVLWLEHYRRAYSQIIMRVLEEDGDALTA